MSALPSAVAAVSALASSPSAAGSLSAAAGAEQHALLTADTHATTAVQARAAVLSVPIDCAVDVLPGGVTPIAASAAVVELPPSAAAPSSPSASADSAKSLAHAPIIAGSAQAQAQAPGSSGSRDKGEKHGSSPSSAPIGSASKAKLLAAASADQLSHNQGRISPPSHVAAGAAGVGGSSGAAASASAAALSPLQSLFASLADSFHPRRAPASSAAAQHDVAMRDVDGVGASSSSSLGSSSWAAEAASIQCLVIDAEHLASAADDRKHLHAVLNSATVLTADERMEAVLSWLPALQDSGLSWVFPVGQRLHLHFKDHAFLARALKAVPFLVRCGLPGGSWSAPCVSCTGVERHKQPEALHFTVSTTEAAPASLADRMAAIKRLLADMGIEVQAVWQSHQKVVDPHAAARVTFWVLPREADISALVGVIERVHRKHTLFGGLVAVQGPNSPRLARCHDCRALGHQNTACPLFGGVAVRLLFKKPLAPAAFRQLTQAVPGVRASMLGNTHSEDQWSSAYKATLFFDRPSESSLAAMEELQLSLQTLTSHCRELLFQPPSHVVMTEASRRQECVTCGRHEKEHMCPFRDNAPQRQLLWQQQQQQQQHKQPVPAKVPAAAAAAAGAAAAKGAASKQAAAVPMHKGMCGELRKFGVCRRPACKQLHPDGWIVPPSDCCRDFYMGACQRPEGKCIFRHFSLADAKAAAAASASSAAASAGPKPLPSVVLRGTAGKAPSQKKKKGASAAQQRSDDGNMFSVLVSASDAAAGPSTPRKVQASSLSLLSSPTRSFSTPNASVAPRPSGRSSKKKLTGALDASESAVAAAAGDGGAPFQQQKGRKRRKADTSPQQEEEKGLAEEKDNQQGQDKEQQQPPRRQPLPSPQQQQPSASEPMDH